MLRIKLRLSRTFLIVYHEVMKTSVGYCSKSLQNIVAVLLFLLTYPHHNCGHYNGYFFGHSLHNGMGIMSQKIDHNPHNNGDYMEIKSKTITDIINIMS